jgi:hypothetical protein
LNNDLGFLTIFIILPTILIVSGFWLILIVRSDMPIRRVSETTTADEETAPRQIFAESSDDSPEIAAIANRDTANSESDAEDEFWTPAPTDHTESMPLAIEPPDAEPEDFAESNIETEMLPPPPVFANDTENLPEQWEIDLSADEDKEETIDDQDRAQRQPGTMMVPSTEHVMRRTGQSARRAPTVGRSTVRDEDIVERPDSS